MRRNQKAERHGRKLVKKARGEIQHFLPAFIFIPACFIVIMLFVNYNDAINKKTEIDQVARKYLLSMERRGGLVPSEQAKMLNDLDKYGFYDIDISGTDLSDGTIGVGYGNEVHIRITATCDTYMLGTSSNMFNLAFMKSPKTITVEYSSTAKN